MNARELHAAFGLAGIFGLRMLGLFIILPVFALYATDLRGGNDLTLVGIALGAYGLAQAILQIPFGRWSDSVGRKRVMYVGLMLFAGGSFLAGYADSILGVIAGRTLQGAGAISAVTIAMAADLTRDEHRTKVMAIIGAMIGLSFGASLICGPWLNRLIGVPGIFYLIGVLALVAMVIVFVLPNPAQSHSRDEPVSFGEILQDVELKRLNVGIFVLHALLMALFVTIPLDLVAAGLSAHEHWRMYAAVVFGAFVLMAPAVHLGDRRGKSKMIFLASIVLVGLGQLLLLALARSLIGIGVALLVFFTGFMVLEAALPAQVSRAAPAGGRGTAIAVYSTVQFLGAFCGGALGGFVMQNLGRDALLGVNVAMVTVWLAVARHMRNEPAVSLRTFPIKDADVSEAAGLAERLSKVSGVREARLNASARIAYLKVDASRFDEQDVLKLIAGES
jgi:MFS family permease